MKDNWSKEFDELMKTCICGIDDIKEIKQFIHQKLDEEIYKAVQAERKIWFESEKRRW